MQSSRYAIWAEFNTNFSKIVVVVVVSFFVGLGLALHRTSVSASGARWLPRCTLKLARPKCTLLESNGLLNELRKHPKLS